MARYMAGFPVDSFDISDTPATMDMAEKEIKSIGANIGYLKDKIAKIHSVLKVLDKPANTKNMDEMGLLKLRNLMKQMDQLPSIQYKNSTSSRQ